MAHDTRLGVGRGFQLAAAIVILLSPFVLVTTRPLWRDETPAGFRQVDLDAQLEERLRDVQAIADALILLEQEQYASAVALLEQEMTSHIASIERGVDMRAGSMRIIGVSDRLRTALDYSRRHDMGSTAPFRIQRLIEKLGG